MVSTSIVEMKLHQLFIDDEKNEKSTNPMLVEATENGGVVENFVELSDSFNIYIRNTSNNNPVMKAMTFFDICFSSYI